MYRIVNPVAGGVRMDAAGSGVYGAPRNGRKHAGLDLICAPGEIVKSPIRGVITRIAYPYPDTSLYQGVEIEGDVMTLKLFYVKPYYAKIGQMVTAAEEIGVAQDVRVRYPDEKDMLPHVHLEIVKVNPALFLDLRFASKGSEHDHYPIGAG